MSDDINEIEEIEDDPIEPDQELAPSMITKQEKIRRQIEEDVKRFLEAGGQITELPQGQNTYKVNWSR